VFLRRSIRIFLSQKAYNLILVPGTITLATRGKRRATLSTTTVATEATTAEVTGLAAAIEAVTTATEAAEVVDGEIDLHFLVLAASAKGMGRFYSCSDNS